MEAVLALENGVVLRGRSFGAPGERCGEVVFNTSMTGYQEILTDPSYRGQILVMTCPEIGNTGANPDDLESETPQVEGFVVREATDVPSSWRANQGLQLYLREHRVVAACEFDTRAVTRTLRIHGTLRGVLSTIDADAESLVRKARAVADVSTLDLVGRVTRCEPAVWSAARDPRWTTRSGSTAEAPRMRCVAYDFGAKRNIFRLLHECGFDVTAVPAGTSADEALRYEPDAVFLSNGPGDPATADYAVRAVRDLLGRVPIFGICLGHQIAALALGARTYKLKFGHRGANHPVKDVASGTVAVTSQNHGYSVDPETLPSGSEVTHVSLYDGTCEGFVHRQLRLLAVQFHPEASSGPHDSLHLFEGFRAMVRSSVESAARTAEGGP